MKTLRLYGLIIAKSLGRFRRRVVGFIRSRRRYGIMTVVILLLTILTTKLLINYYTQQTLSEGIVGVYTIHNLPPSVTNLISQSLVVLDESGQPKPHLAESWRVNNDATEYTFTLHDNLYWSDGSRVRAADLNFDFPNVSISYPDDRTIVFRFKESYSPLLSQLTTPIFKEDSLIGMGKYKVTTLQYDRDRIKVTRMTLQPLQPNLPDLTIRFYQDEKTAKTAFYIGEIQALIGVSEVNDIISSPLIAIKRYPNYNKLVAVFFNTKDPVLGDKNLRKALSFATPKLEDEEYAKTSLPPFSWAFNNQVRDYIGHADQAKSFLEKAKFDKNVPIILTTPPQLASQAERIVQGWKSIGVSAVTRVESGNPQSFQAALFIEPIINDPDQYLLWHSTQTRTNISGYKSDRVDRDLEDGRKTTDTQLRRERYQDMQKVLADDEPATFLYFQKLNLVYIKKAEKNLNKIVNWQFD